MRVLVWNVQWRRPTDPIRALVRAFDPDVAVLTETSSEQYFDGGQWISSNSDYGYNSPASRRKVSMWSRHQWGRVDSEGEKELPPGRFVSAETDSLIGSVRFFGVCIPWRDAHVRTGQRNRELWEDHLAYLEGLEPILSAAPSLAVLAGDWNQRIPRYRQPARVFDALVRSRPSSFGIATSGSVPGVTRQLIDHVAVSPGLEVRRVQGFPRATPEHGVLSDHDGVVVDLAANGSV